MHTYGRVFQQPAKRPWRTLGLWNWLNRWVDWRHGTNSRPLGEYGNRSFTCNGRGEQRGRSCKRKSHSRINCQRIGWWCGLELSSSQRNFVGAMWMPTTMSAEMPLRKSEAIAASKWWIWIAIIVCAVAFIGITRIAFVAYLTDSIDKWSSVGLAFATYFVILLIVAGAFNLCSVKIDAESVRQTRFFSHGRFFVMSQLRWDEITSAMVKPGAYRLSSPSTTIEIHTMVFGDPARVAKFVQDKLPSQLKKCQVR